MQDTLGTVIGLWRYPVKGLQGETLQEAEVDDNGIVGDRVYGLRDVESGRIVAAKNYSYSWGNALGVKEIMSLKAEYKQVRGKNELTDVNVIRSDGTGLSSKDLGMNAFVSDALYRPTELVSFPPLLPARTSSGRAIHLLTTSSLDEIRQYEPASDFDERRFRPNILVRTQEKGFVEEQWTSLTVAVGEVQLKVSSPNKRCSVTTLKQGDLPYDGRILQIIATKNKNNLGVMCSVVKGGLVRIGDNVRQL